MNKKFNNLMITMKFNQYTLCFIFVCILFYIPCSAESLPNADKHKKYSKQIQTEILKIVKKHALFYHPINNKQNIKSYIKSLDSFSDYLSADEYSFFKSSQKKKYVGVGLQLEKNSSGQMICFPFTGGPAKLAGIKSGDILISINNTNIQNKSVFEIGLLSKGIVGTYVTFSIVTKDGFEKKIRIKRAELSSSSIYLKKFDNLSAIEIRSFTLSTRAELKNAFLDLKKQSLVIIDLRNNPGGDMYAAIDCAMLLLSKHKTIVTVKSKDSTETFKSTITGMKKKCEIFIWQNDYTASAAELFIAALTQNQRAHSIGKKSFGKGTRQEVFELSDGSALFLTTAYILTPSGMKYHSVGLEPDFFLNSKETKTKDYVAFQKKIITRKMSIQEKKIPVKLPKIRKDNLSNINKVNTYIICIDQWFNSENAARIFSERIVQSDQNITNVFFQQNQIEGKILYMPCLGPFTNKTTAENSKKKLSKKLQNQLKIIHLTKLHGP